MLVGRDRERRHIQRVIPRARTGESATLALLGESGIGKTALLDYAAERAQGMRVLRTRGVESESEVPFGFAARAAAPGIGAARGTAGEHALGRLLPLDNDGAERPPA